MINYISKIDSERFGFLVAKLNNFSEYQGMPALALADARKHLIRLVISRVSSSDIELINAMEDAGYRLKDVQSIYSRDISSYIPTFDQKALVVYRDFKNEDIEDIASIAAESFSNYGHYSKNEKTNSRGTSDIYADWAKRCCTNSNLCDHIIVAEINGVVAGFLTFKIRYEKNFKYASAFLGAVGKSFRKYGVFQGINIAGLNWAKKESVYKVETNVLITNLPVNKTYAALGFNISGTETTMHCWLENKVSIGLDAIASGV